jgi:hypothetical protein
MQILKMINQTSLQETSGITMQKFILRAFILLPGTSQARATAEDQAPAKSDSADANCKSSRV